MIRSLKPSARFCCSVTWFVAVVAAGTKQEVAAGQAIALSGSTGFTSGPHLHFDAVNVLPQASESARQDKEGCAGEPNRPCSSRKRELFTIPRGIYVVFAERRAGKTYLGCFA